MRPMKRPLTEDRVRTPEEALAYMTECALATHEVLLLRSRVSQSDLRRARSIAELGVRWCRAFGVEDRLLRTLPPTDEETP